MSDAPDRDRSPEDILWPDPKPATSATSPPATSPPTSAPFPTDKDGYRYTQLERVLDQRKHELFVELNMTEARRRAALDQYIGILNTTGLHDNVMARIAELHLEGELSAGRRARADDPEAEADHLAAAHTARQRRRARRGDRALRRGGGRGPVGSRAAVGSHPPVARMFQQYGFGRDPAWLAIELADHVVRSGYR